MHISSTCDKFPLKITVKINVIKLNKTKSKIADRINFLLFKSIWKKQIIKKLLIKKINPSCINNINGNKKIIKRIDNSFFFKELRRKRKTKKEIKNNISFLPIAA